MSSDTSVASYVALHARLYTGGYVADGGSVVRAVLGNSATRERLRAAIQADGEEKDFQYAHVDSREIKIQQLQDVFFAVSARINWLGVVRRWLRRILADRFDVDGLEMTLDGILRREQREPFVVRQRLDELISEKLLRKSGLSGEFRRAIYHLVWSILEPHSVRNDATPHVIAWLQGRLEKVYYVRSALLFRKITKTNARQMLTSLSRWLRDCGFKGLVVTIDLGTIILAPKMAIGNKYTRAALMDVYEVLRQFIDATDEVEGLSLLILADESFADDVNRGIEIYRALRMRLSDDVWDSKRTNAMATMVRLST